MHDATRANTVGRLGRYSVVYQVKDVGLIICELVVGVLVVVDCLLMVFLVSGPLSLPVDLNSNLVSLLGLCATQVG